MELVSVYFNNASFLFIRMWEFLAECAEAPLRAVQFVFCHNIKMRLRVFVVLMSVFPKYKGSGLGLCYIKLFIWKICKFLKLIMILACEIF